MQRKSFLEAQPFLFPLGPATSWPPTFSTETSDRKSCRGEILLQDHFVSIEPLSLHHDSKGRDNTLSQQSIRQIKGPAFFFPPAEANDQSENTSENYLPEDNTKRGKSHSCPKFDPAMDNFELSIHSTTFLLPPQALSSGDMTRFSARVTSPSALKKLLRKELPKEGMKVNESAIFFRINNDPYQVDLRQVENIDVQLSDAHELSSRPHSLLVQFGHICVFRIFSMTGTSAESLFQLQGIRDQLIQILTGEGQVASTFPSRDVLTSPTGSHASTLGAYSSGNEHGQLESIQSPQGGDCSARITGAHGGSLESANVKKQDAATVVGGTEQSFKATISYKSAYMQAKTNVNILERMLFQPVHFGDSKSYGKEIMSSRQERIRTLLSTIPKQLASSYCTQSTLELAIQHQNERINSYQEDMEALIHSFWPTTKRCRTSNDSTTASGNRQISIESRPTTAECVARSEDLQRLHKEATQEKISLCFLPTRG